MAPADERVKAGAVLEVVRVSDLRQFLRDKQADPLRMLQGLGMATRDTPPTSAADWRVTLFDVKAEWMCRPIEGGTPGEEAGAVSVCDAEDQGALDKQHADGFTGCGYTLDTGAATRGLDVYRVSWEVASSQGFCVWPLSRFMDGA